VIPVEAGTTCSSEVAGESYGDDHAEQEAPEQQGTGPGEGKNDAPATSGTHRGWGDPQAEPDDAA
jgi:hypothetical protein